jgi:DNA repair exonuclease SbcCD ATPase subunit
MAWADLKLPVAIAETCEVAAFRAARPRMESVHQIQEALSARSRTATLDELRNEGRKRVRLIRAEHVAAMIAEAVHNAIEQSGLIAPEEAQGLVEKSRQEFRAILREREEEHRQAQATEEALAQREAELVERDTELAQRDTELAELRGQLEQAEAALREAQAESYRLRAQFESLQDQFASLQQQQVEAAAPAPVAVPAPAPAPAAGPSTDLLLSLVQELATLKASVMTQQHVPVPVSAGTDVSAALEKLAGSLNDRLEQLGKKMGVSAAVDGDAPVDFSGMFKDAGGTLESNMNNIEVKQKAGGGIAANLARLKKLKGGGS